MGKIHQVQTAIACSLGSILIGILFVWPSYTLQLYTDTNTTHIQSPMSETESSLVGSLPSLGAMLGTAATGWIIGTFGRKRGALIIIALLLFTWILIDLTGITIVILIARFFGGAAGGAFSVVNPIFISEVAEESIRGALTSAPMACYCVGVLISYALGWSLTYRYIIWANVGLCLLYTVLMMTVTESPVYLMRRQKEEEARLAIAHYRGVSVASKVALEEFSRIKQLLAPAIELTAINSDEKGTEAEKEKLNNEVREIEPAKKLSSLKMLFASSSSSRRAFIVVCLTLTNQVMMGMVAVQVYAKDIFSEAAPNLSSHLCSVLFALVLFLGSLLSVLFSDRFGRKFLLISSSTAVTLCLCGMGFLMQTNIAPPIVTAGLILCYCFAFMFGAGSVPYVLLAECFVPEVQSLASMLLMEWVWFLNFFIVGIFPFMVKFLGAHGSFYTFACFGISNIFVTIGMVPETKGLTKEEIQLSFLRKRLN